MSSNKSFNIVRLHENNNYKTFVVQQRVTDDGLSEIDTTMSLIDLLSFLYRVDFSLKDDYEKYWDDYRMDVESADENIEQYSLFYTSFCEKYKYYGNMPYGFLIDIKIKERDENNKIIELEEINVVEYIDTIFKDDREVRLFRPYLGIYDIELTNFILYKDLKNISNLFPNSPYKNMDIIRRCDFINSYIDIENISMNEWCELDLKNFFLRCYLKDPFSKKKIPEFINNSDGDFYKKLDLISFKDIKDIDWDLNIPEEVNELNLKNSLIEISDSFKCLMGFYLSESMSATLKDYVKDDFDNIEKLFRTIQHIVYLKE